tara:strand:- start:5 stop:403 length:399 start_codon:yes stop_codon:yes gene_type:complete
LRKKSVLKSKNYELVVYDGLTASKVLVHLEAKGISNVRLIKTAYSKSEALKLILRSKAILKAQVNSFVKPLGQALDKATYISDKYYSNNYYSKTMNRMKVAYDSDGVVEKPLDLGFSGIKVESEVMVRFSIL